MNSILLTALARGLFSILCAIALYLLFRGHTEPGGGFIGGLVAAVAFAMVAKGMGSGKAKSLLRFKSINIMATGMALALCSGVIALAVNQPFMTGRWWFAFASDSYAGFPLSTIMLFDIGVFLVVLGATLTFFFALEDADS